MQFTEFVEQQGRSLHFEAGEHLFRQGDENRCLYVVREGLVKAYYLSDDGRETIKSFVQTGDMIGSLAATWSGQRCSFGVVCLEPVLVTELDFAALYAASHADLEVASAMIEHLLGFAMKKERREMEFLTKTAEARYRLLVDRSPDLLERATQKDIARYLGITPVALSRIRKRSKGHE